MKIRPLQDKILLRRTPQEEQTRGGIFIPANAKTETNIGVVVAVGTGKRLPNGQTVKPSVEVGERVAFGKFVGTELRRDGEALLMVKDDDILAVLG